MRALVLQRERDLPDSREVPDVRPRAGEALVKVSAAGMNYSDLTVRRLFHLERIPFPHIPGMEFCGTVIECGEGVTDVKPGDRVMGIASHACAELIAAPVGALLPV